MINTEFRVKAADLLTAIKRVKHCMSDNESRRELMGINLFVSEDNLNRLNIMAADGYRIARQSIDVSDAEPFNITIDPYAIKDRTLEKYLKQYTALIITKKEDEYIHGRIEKNILRLFNSTETKILFRKEKEISFKADPHNLKIRLKDEEYPTNEIDRLLIGSESKENQITIKDINTFYRAAEYLYYASDALPYQSIKLALSDVIKHPYGDQKSVNISTAVPDNSDKFKQASFNIEAEDGNIKTHIGLNVMFLKEALKIFKTLKACNLTLSWEGKEQPCYMKTETNDTRLETGNTFIQLILAVKLKYC